MAARTSSGPSAASGPASPPLGAVALALAVGAAACGGGQAGPSPPPELPLAAACGLFGAQGARFAVDATSGSVIPRTEHTFCPDGPAPETDPPTCVGELDLAAARDATFTPTARGGTLAAVVPFRFPRLVTRVFQTAGTIGSGSVAVAGNGACPGAAQTPADLPVEVSFSVTEDGGLDATASADPAVLGFATVGCISGNLASRVSARVEAAGGALIRARLQRALELALETELCTGPPCPGGFAEVDGLCRRDGAARAPCLARPRDPRTPLLEPVACVP
jgi:hypothetical protein